MAYRALYRQYRPQSFSTVIGQEYITTTLKNQVSSGRISHAYLFCGTRGTGKTTTARILARAVNCLSPAEGEPCGECRACSCTNENSGDIIEIDAASNNGVDDVRALIENAQYAPINLKRRVFIIDEVHMLSPQAFNALLKTLEEPPSHILFILATTEPQKLPVTIVSRCQRYDFHRLTIYDIVHTLQNVLSSAGMFIDEGGLTMIARVAEGSMRDALSLCDQCLAFCGEHVSKQDVYDVLGSVEEGFLFDFADKLVDGDAAGTLYALSNTVQNGSDLTVFASDLARHFRSLLVAKTCGECKSLLECTPDTMSRYLDQASSTSDARLLFALETLLDTLAEMRYQSSPRIILESALVRICRPEDTLSLISLEARIAKLEESTKNNRVGEPAVSITALDISAVPPETNPLATIAATSEIDDAQPYPKAAKNRSGFQDLQKNDDTVDPEPLQGFASLLNSDAADAQLPAPAEAEELWQMVLTDMKKSNIMVFKMAESGRALSLDDNTLCVGFPNMNESQFQSVSAAINLNRLQAILTAKQPGLQLRLIKTKAEPTSDAVSIQAREVFGDTSIT